MQKYKLVDNNIVINTDVEITLHCYSLPLINTEFTSHNTSEIVSKYLTQILKSVNMYADIYLIPKKIDSKKIISHYDRNFSKYGRNEISDIYNVVREDTLARLDDYYRYDYKLVLVFVNDNKHYFKSNLKGLKSKKNLEVTNRMIKYAKSVGEAILGKMTKIYPDSRKLEATETIEFLKYIEVPEYEYNNYSYRTFDDHMYFKYENDNQIDEKYSMIASMSEFPYEIEGYFTFVSDIQKLTFPVDIILKVEPLLNAPKIEREIENQSNLVKADDQKYKRETGKGLKENKIKSLLAVYGSEEFENINNYMFKFQAYIRITARSKEMIDDRYNVIKKKLAIDSKKTIKSSLLLGNQAKAFKHILPGRFTINNYVHHVNKEFFTSLKLVSGVPVGDEEGIVLGFTKPGDKPVLIDVLAPMEGRSKHTSTSILITGVTGSGKSQFANTITLIMSIVLGISSLIIDPKGDRSKLAKKYSFINEIKISDPKYKGALDPFLSEDDNDALLNSVGSLVKSLLYVNDTKKVYDHYSVSEAFKSYTENNYNRSFVGFLKELAKYNEELSKDVLSFENNKYASLYFSNGSDVVHKLAFTSLCTIINLDAPAEIDKESLDMSDQLLKLVVSRCESIVRDFIKNVSGPKCVGIDEVKIFKALATMNFVDNIIRTVRSMKCILLVMSQNYTDFTDDELNNFGQFIIGSVGSTSQLGLIADKFQLNVESLNFLKIDNNNPSVKESDKHQFLLVDANQKKARVKQKILNLFGDVFNTQLNRGASDEESV